MKLKLLCAALALCVSSNANAAKQYIDLKVEGGQESRMDSGIEAITSDLPSSSARVFEPEGRVEKRVAIRVMVYNAGDRPFNFGPENISVEASTGQAVAVIPYEQLVKEEKSRQTWAAIGAALGAMGNAVNASNAGYNSGTVSAFGSGGSWARGTYSSYNSGQAYAAQAIATQQNQAMFDRMHANNAAAMEALGVNMRTSTVDPGEAFGGQVVLELPSEVRKSKVPVELLVRVGAGDDTHTFKAQLVRR